MSTELPHRSPKTGDRRLDLLGSPLFLLAVGLLVANDWVLKPAFGNWVTGKLSDFAGLFAFAIFWTAFFPRWRRAVFAGSALAFVLWKSSLSDPFLLDWNALGVWPLQRVVDYSDWIALLALLPAYRAVVALPRVSPREARRTARRVVSIASATVALLAFLATSRALPSHDLRDVTAYRLAATPADVKLALNTLSIRTYNYSARGSAVDTVSIDLRNPSRYSLFLLVELRDGSDPMPATVIRLLSVITDAREPWTEAAVHEMFREQVLDPLRLRLGLREDYPLSPPVIPPL